MSLRPALQQGSQQRLVFLQFYGADACDGQRRIAGLTYLTLYVLRDSGRVALSAAAEAQMQHRRTESQHRKILGNVRQQTRSDCHQQGEAAKVHSVEAVEDFHVLRTGPLEESSAGIPHFQQQGGRTFLYKSEDCAVHLSMASLRLPAELPAESVEGPEAFIVALGGDYRFGTDGLCDAAGQVVCSSHVAGHHRYGELAGAVNADDCRVAVFVLQQGSYAAHANADCSDENHCVESVPAVFQGSAAAYLHFCLRAQRFLQGLRKRQGRF